MAFVGYRTVDDAAAALKYFNNTFIDTCRISIEVRGRHWKLPGGYLANMGHFESMLLQQLGSFQGTGIVDDRHTCAELPCHAQQASRLP